MKKNVIRVIVLLAVFIGTLVGVGTFNKQTNEDLTKNMSQASLPVVTLYYGDTKINELHGYVNEMNAQKMRDSITPVSETDTIPMDISAYSHTISGISYQIRSLDTTELLVDTAIEEYTQEKGIIHTEIPIQSIVDEGTEYQMILTLYDDETAFRYYTRIIKPVNCYVEETLQFAMEFHNASMNKDTYETLSTYMEPSSEGDNSSLHKVTIHSSLKQVGWADLQVETLIAPIPRIVEVNSSYNVILMDYVVSSLNDNGELEYYNVEEYYRIRHTAQRDYLLNYERTMDELYRGEYAQFSKQYIDLGICDEEVHFKSNETGDAVAFVQEGELWCYLNQTGRLCQVFSFRGFEGVDNRENYNQHDIRIIDIDEAGSINFAVYGYMNRGDHEGEVGIEICHYDCTANTVEEEAFIPFDSSYEVLKSNIRNVIYESDSGMFYLMLEDTVYGIDLSDRSVSVIKDDLEEGSYVVSESNRYFAYIEGDDENAATELVIYDFETSEATHIEAENGECVKPLGFMEEDFIYGTAKSSDIQVDGAGNTTFAMYKVTILSTDDTKEVLKEYEKQGYYISGIEVDGYTIYLNRMIYDGTSYVDAAQDTIMNREGENMKTVTVDTIVTDAKETEIRIDIGNEITDTSPKLLTPKEVVLEEDRTVNLEVPELGEKYYVYAQGKVWLSTYQLADAVSVANENMGVVIGENQRYVWMRARKTSVSEIPVTITEESPAENTIAAGVSALLGTHGINIGVQTLMSEGNSAREILEDGLRDVTFIDLVGCDVEETLFYISKGVPVFALTGANEAVLLVGYDSSSVIIYDPAVGASYRKSFEDAREMFEAAGNVFLTYLS